ncbi:glycoside hydrolase family 16 protein [Arthrobacter sp. M4]|uniref:glycoside hydrolase family 16 protein n=1 Tax=Arthrobacter sp. M4 TaxID=218160 RepID=UPI001CDC7DE4|nr:glycoside hydrolase family 16 protein [Arthrobacter sp. M4]MCA4135035.1 glycoside hydrolase family 16 protein [Arthrobacter sp. M4]
MTPASHVEPDPKKEPRSLAILRSRTAGIVAIALLLAGIVSFAVTSRDSSSMPLGDLPGWRQTGAEDFSTPAAKGLVGRIYGRDMRGYSDLRDSSNKGIYSPDMVLSVEDGKLDYFLHTEDAVPRVASVIPFGYSGQKFGRYSVRFRADSMPGYKIAFMLWPTSDSWGDGEVDWPEGGLDGSAYAASAINGSLENGGMRFDPPSRIYAPTDMTDWHIATTEWTPGSVKFFWDGQLVSQTTDRTGVPFRKLRWTLQAETMDGTDPSLPAPEVSGHLQIDWAVQYAYEPVG